MSEYIRAKADEAKVEHLHSGKSHFYKVTRKDGSSAEVSIKINCTCSFMGKQGQANGDICSDVLATLREIHNRADIRIQHEDNTLDKRNSCKQLVRLSNRHLNEIRYGENEGKPHQQEKWNICMALERQGKHYYTEAIIDEAGLRADILVLDTFTVIEIADTESDASLEKKRKKYKSIGLTMEVIRISPNSITPEKAKQLLNEIKQIERVKL